MKTFFFVVVLALSTFTFTSAGAHGEAKAKHGGVVATSQDLTFELVSTADGVTIYIDDHGKPLASTGMSGKLTVLSGANKTEAELKAAGENRLAATGTKLSAGAKAVAVITGADGKKFTVRFAVK
jgi:hypothetical protein